MIRRYNPSLFCLIPAFALLALSSQANATPFSVRSEATAGTGGFISNAQQFSSDTGQVQATSNSAGPLSAESSGPGYDFTATADNFTQIGAIHSSVSTGVSSNGPPGGASAGTVGSWSDTITITSDTLPAGAPVSFLATITLHRTITGTPPVNGDGGTASAQLFGPFGLSLSDFLTSPNPTQSVSTVVNTTVGATLTASSELDLLADSSGSHPPFTKSAAVFAENTGRFDFEPLTAGASYSTASGVMFVPEPASFWLICCGLIPLGIAAMHRRVHGAGGIDPAK